MATNKPPDAGAMLQGTLDMLILRTLVVRPAHGHTIARNIETTSEHFLEVEQGSLYPALHRMEDRGWVSAPQHLANYSFSCSCSLVTFSDSSVDSNRNHILHDCTD